MLLLCKFIQSLNTTDSGAHFGLLVAAIILVMLISKSLEALFSLAVENSVTLRKLVMGSQFMEGYWIDKVVDVANDNTMLSVGILKISFYHGMIMVSGTGYSPKYDPLGSFQTYISKYDAFTLKYGYVSILPRDGGTEVHGHGQYMFSQGNDSPVRFTGFMQDSHFTNKILIEGEKISDKAILRHIDENETRANLVSAFANRALYADN